MSIYCTYTLIPAHPAANDEKATTTWWWTAETQFRIVHMARHMATGFGFYLFFVDTKIPLRR